MYHFFLKYRQFLLPFSWLYAWVIGIRNWMFDINILPSESFKTPTISIGNIAVGGTFGVTGATTLSNSLAVTGTSTTFGIGSSTHVNIPSVSTANLPEKQTPSRVANISAILIGYPSR